MRIDRWWRRHAKMGFDPAGGTPDVLMKKLRDEVSKWTDIARQKNIRIQD